MLSTKIKSKILNNKFIDIDSRFSFYDINIKRISEYILKLEQNKYKKIFLYSQYKINILMDIKQKLNIKKKTNIDLLRTKFKFNYNNPVVKNVSYLHNLYNDSENINISDINDNKKDIIKFMVKNKIVNSSYLRMILKPYLLVKNDNDYLIVEKILRGLNSLELLKLTLKYCDFDSVLLKQNYSLITTINKYLRILTNTINIDSDIKKIEILIKQFKNYLLQLKKYNPFIYKNQYSKINQFDLFMLSKNKTTQNIKQISYFYLIKCKKINNSKNDLYRDNLKDKLSLSVISQKDINKLIEQNFKTSFKDIDIKIKNKTNSFIDFIINKYF